MSEDTFEIEERYQLLAIARRGVIAAANQQSPPIPDIDLLSDSLQSPRACFVTLKMDEALRGCTGTILAKMPLAKEVAHAAYQTAMNDPRFSPVQPDEISRLDISISVLSIPKPLAISNPRHLPTMLRQGIDGVILKRGYRRTTFLPQVWQQIPDPTEFLNRLCRKMGLPNRAWLFPGMEVAVYQVEAFSEKEMAEL